MNNNSGKLASFAHEMDKLKNTDRSIWIYCSVAIFLFVYLFLRSVFVPLVYDEAATFFIYILPGEFIPFHAYWDANNHFLNSFLGIVSSHIFGHSEWALRLPNVLFFVFSIFFVFKLKIFFENKAVWLCMALTVLFSHNLIEYSAYCRGYGMAISCMIGCIYFLLDFIKSNSSRSLTWLNLISFLTLAANLTLLNVVLIITGLVLVYALYSKRLKAVTYIFIIANLVCIVLAVWVGIELKKRGLLYYGSQEGFYKVTLTSLSNLMFGSLTKVLPVVFIVLTILLLLMYILKAKAIGMHNVFLKPVTVAGILFAGSIVAIISLNVFLKVNYPEDRTALYLYPLFLLFLFFSVDSFFKTQTAVITSLSITLVVLFHFVNQLNLAYSTYWKQERVPQTFYHQIAEDWKGKEHKVFISAYRMKGYIWNYYTYRSPQKLNEIYHQHFPSSQADYLIIEEDNYNKCPDVIKNYNQVLFDRYNHIRLLKNKRALNYQLVFDSVLTENRTINYSYVDLFDMKIDSDTIKNAAAEFECELTTDKLSYIDFVFKAMMGSETLSEAVCRTQWQREKWITPDNKTKNRIFLEDIKGADKFVLFINGREGESYKLSNLKVRIFSF